MIRQFNLLCPRVGEMWKGPFSGELVSALQWRWTTRNSAPGFYVVDVTHERSTLSRTCRRLVTWFCIRISEAINYATSPWLFLEIQTFICYSVRISRPCTLYSINADYVCIYSSCSLRLATVKSSSASDNECSIHPVIASRLMNDFAKNNQQYFAYLIDPPPPSASLY
jgi:hypothetical protein